MICPSCGYDNLPGSEECTRCQQDLTQLDRPAPQNRVERSLMENQVAALPPRQPLSLPPTGTVREAIAALLSHDLGALLVLDDDGKLLGIFSERDLLTKLAGLETNYADLPIGKFMTPHPESVTATDTLAFVLHKMDVGGYRHLPVLDNGRAAGMISVRDMMRHIARACHDH